MRVQTDQSKIFAVLLFSLLMVWGLKSAFAEESSKTPAAPPSSTPAKASSPSGESWRLKEIVVSAERRNMPIQKVPIAVTALGAEQLRDQDIKDLTDLTTRVPGFSYGTSTGGGQRIAIRGVATSAEFNGVEAPIATYVDGIYQPRDFRSSTIGIDVERIEVLRGPQGTLFGRNATGGAVNIILEKPTDEFLSGVDLGIGDYGQRTAEGMVSGPLSSSKTVMARFVGAFDYYGGDVENVWPQRVTPKYVNGFANRSGRLALRYRPSENMTVDFNLLTNEENGGALAPDTNNIVAPNPALEFATGLVVPPTASMTNLFISGNHPYEAKLDGARDGDAKNVLASGTITLDLSWATLRSITGYQDRVEHRTYDGDGTARDLIFDPFINDADIAWTQEFDVFGSNEWLTWLVGAYYFDERYRENTFAQRDASFGGLGLDTFLGYFETVKSGAGFGDVTVPLPYHFNIFGGTRYTKDEKKAVEGFQLYLGGVPEDLGTACLNATSNTSFSNWSPRYGIGWQPTDNLNFYVKRSFGYNAGGTNAASCNETYKPEYLDAIEFGVKSQWFDGLVRADLSLFTQKYRNLQIFVDLNVTRSDLINVPTSKMKGGELEVTARPLERLTIDTGFSLVDARYVDFQAYDPTNPQAGVQNLDGHEMNFAPHDTESVGVEYVWPAKFVDFDTFMLRGEYFHTADIVFRPFGGTGYGGSEDKQDAYSIVNLFATLSRGEALECRAFVKNVLNTQYYAEKFALASGQRLGVPGTPRTFGVQMTYWFGKRSY